MDNAAIWAGALLAFLGGVRRGLTFRAADGGSIGAIAASLLLFCSGCLVLWLLAVGHSVVGALVLPILGFAAAGLLDAAAGRERDAPPYFANLRPAQMTCGAAALLALLLRAML